MPGRPITYPGQQSVNGALPHGARPRPLARRRRSGPVAPLAFIVLSLLLGVLFVLPIGGADMPVIISLLNSFTGLAVAASGFVLEQRRPHRERHARRRVGNAPDADDEQGDEPLDRQRALQRVRQDPGERAAPPADPTAAPSAPPPSRTWRRCSRSRTRSSSSPATASRSRTRSTRCRSSPTSSRRGRRGLVRDPSGRRPHARSHERAARRGQRPVRRAQGAGCGQRRVSADRRRCRRRRQRRRQSRTRADEPGPRSTACPSSTSTTRRPSSSSSAP